MSLSIFNLILIYFNNGGELGEFMVNKVTDNGFVMII